MKVLLTHRPGGAYGYISEAWGNAFRSKGHEVERWDGDQNTWMQFRPDLYLGCSGHRQPIPKLRDTKVAIHVNPYGPIDLGPINEPADAIAWTVKQKPDVVFGYGHKEDSLLWSHWAERHNINWVPMATAGDKCVYKLTNTGPRQLDVAYVGGFWSYKAMNMEPYLGAVLNSGLKCEFRGWGDWPAKYSSSPISDDEVVNLYNNAKIVPCISEPHTYKFNIDVPERAFKAALCGALIVHDQTMAIKKYIPSALVAMNPNDMAGMCKYFSDPANAEERNAIANAQMMEVLNNNTYHSRLDVMLEALGFSDRLCH